MASYFDFIGLKGASNWMKVQYQEEMMHAMKMYDYLYLRGQRVTLLPIESPPSTWESPLEVFKNTLSHEQKVSEMIKNLYQIALEEKDSDAERFLEWYVKEQVEEEESALDKVKKFTDAGGDENKIKQIDDEMAKRIFH